MSVRLISTRLAAPAALLYLGCLSMPAAAATFTVTHDGASGPGSFRQAVADAAAVPVGVTAEIEFEAVFFGETRRVVLDQPLPLVKRSLVIKGPALGPAGEPMVMLSGDANGTGVVDAGDVPGLFVEVPVGGLLSVRRVGFSGFRTTALPGGAVSFRPSGPAQLVLEQCVFSGNQARWGGAVSVPGDGHEVSVRECLFVGNRAEDAEGGAMYLEASPAVVEACVFRDNSARQGGAIHTSHGAVELRACWFENNEARETGEGGAVSARRGVRIFGSTFSGNRAHAGGALFFNQMLAPAPGAVIENSTFSGNVATAGSGGALFAVSTQAVIRHCTITLNRANGTTSANVFAGGGGIAVPEAANINRIELHNSVVAGNWRSGLGPAEAVDLQGPPAGFRSLGGNVLGVGGSAASVFVQPGDGYGSLAQPLEAKLGPLGDHGGPLPTHLPDPESPVVDAGVAGPGEGLAFDQRGLPRPGGPAPDAGAVEWVTLGYPEWAGFFLVDQGAPSPVPGEPPVLSPMQEPEADPDGDGVPNVREYLVGGDPLRPSGDALVRVVPDPAAGGLAVRYLMASHVVPGSVEVFFDVSESLEVWMPVVPTPASREVGRVGSLREMEVLLPAPGGPGYYVRLGARLAGAGGD